MQGVGLKRHLKGGAKMKRLNFGLVLILILVFSIGYVEAQTHRHWRYDLSKLEYGMSTDEVRRTWGRPDHFNRYADRGREVQQWIYRETEQISIYLYFVNGSFSSYQTFGDK
jgi:hypothetical protein